MKGAFLSTTTLGKWSVWSCIAFLILIVIVFIAVIFSPKDQISQNFFAPLWVAITFLIAGACGTIALVSGFVGIIRSKERSVLVFLATAIGLFALFLILGEFLTPH